MKEARKNAGLTTEALADKLNTKKSGEGEMPNLPLKMVISGIKMNTVKTMNVNFLKHEIIPQGTLAADTCKNGFCKYHWRG